MWPLRFLPSLLPSLLISTSYDLFAHAEPVLFAKPRAVPVASTLPEATARPESVFDDESSVVFDKRQTVVANAPFSGAIYIVGQNGAQLTPASAALCPNQAPQGCGNIGTYNWCCPSGNTCAWASPDQSVVGCCPNGAQCSGSIARNQITTITVYQTVYNAPATTIIAPGGGYASPAPPPNGYVGYCSTLFANGPNLPTTAAGLCGTILVLNGAAGRGFGWGLWTILASLYAGLGIWARVRR